MYSVQPPNSTEILGLYIYTHNIYIYMDFCFLLCEFDHISPRSKICGFMFIISVGWFASKTTKRTQKTQHIQVWLEVVCCRSTSATNCSGHLGEGFLPVFVVWFSLVSLGGWCSRFHLNMFKAWQFLKNKMQHQFKGNSRMLYYTQSIWTIGSWK